jgi:NADH-quinone oxidoreductase subunit H
MALIWAVCCLAETNRAPFDLPEAESELVAGYNVEYSSMGFALYFMAEYSNLILMGTLTALLFLGGNMAPISFLDFLPGSFWISVKAALVVFFFVWVRATLPRYRYDQLQSLCWKRFLPLTLAGFVANAAIVFVFQLAPSIDYI